MKKMIFTRLILSCFIVLILLPGVVLSQKAETPHELKSYDWDSGIFSQPGIGDPVLVATKIIKFKMSPWLRLFFDEYNLGTKSYITVTSLDDGATQQLKSNTLAQWYGTSAYFNGDAVEVKLYAAPGDADIFLSLNQIMIGKTAQGNRSLDSQCGFSDDRTPSDHPASGRIVSVGCTGWLTNTNKLVTAGHCLNGSTANTLEFNVPPSLSDGTIQHPGPEDQYSIDESSKIFTENGQGDDWGIFQVYDNTETGLQPHEAQGASFSLAQDLDPENIRITGFGTDSNDRNQTQQTHVGPNAESSGTTMRYKTDTQGGNSGSPVIDDASGHAVGVHTHGGCSYWKGSNAGTSTFNGDFWEALGGGGGPSAPTAAFSGTPVSGCAPLNVNFTDESSGSINSWAWDFGDGSTSSAQNPGHEYTSAGTYTVALTVTGDGGSDTETKNSYITVNDQPTADFSASPTSGMVPLTVNFTDASTGNPISWSWDFGDGGTSTLQNPTHDYTVAGSYTVILTATNDCGEDTEEKVDFIQPGACTAPTAGFTASPLIGDAPLLVAFTDESTENPTSWAWDFGDGATSAAQNPSHEYANAGVYTVSLTVENDCGSDDEMKTDYITVNEPPPPSDEMHVDNIAMEKQSWYFARRAKATVKIVDQNGASVADATVEGEWSGGASNSSSGSTNSSGEVVLYSSWKWGDADFTFCVTNVIKSGWTYNESANNMTCSGTESLTSTTAISSAEINLDELDEEIKNKLVFNYPNPFNPSTTINFFLPEADQVKVEVYNILGEKILILLEGKANAGLNSIVWNGTDASGKTITSGTYFFKVTLSNGLYIKRKMMLVK